MKNVFYCVGFLAAGLAALPLAADDAATPFRDSAIDARLNVQVAKDTDVVHFVRSNADPDVFTKTYILKHADPYELRGYLREIVQTRKVNESDTGIQALKFKDGTGVLMVSAEDYRFEDGENGKGIDSLIRELDRPSITSTTGQMMYLYSPKYRSGAELRQMVRAAGAGIEGDVTENIGGADRIRCDEVLNTMFFKTAPYSRENIEKVLKTYDVPYPEMRAKITVYELYAENDAKLGLDFQSWKNNDGINLFSTGARFMQNYAPDGSSLVKGGKWSDAKYFNFNPKWNTKYIDFLTSKGKARVMHSCELTVRNNTTAEIERTNQVMLAKNEAADDDQMTENYIFLEDVVSGTDFNLFAKDSAKQSIEINAAGAVTLTVLKIGKEPDVEYILTIKDGNFRVNGVDVGSKVHADICSVSDENGEEIAFENNSPVIGKGRKIKTDASNEFGFRMSITPSITEKAAMLNVNVSNSSLIGYTAGGEARIQRGNELSSQFMISREGTKLVIGGLEKRDIVSVSGGIPFLKDLPLVGWLFSTESQSGKRSQLVVVAEVIPVGNDMTAEIESARKEIDGKLSNSGKSNSFGYRQILIDKDR